MITINNINEYNKFKAGWVEPLILPELFKIYPILRKEIARSIYGKASPNADSIYYKYMWEIKPHWCENCGAALPKYWAGHISHILTRGAYTEYRYEALNSNILCNDCHTLWETGNEERKKKMYIYWINKKRIMEFI